MEKQTRNHRRGRAAGSHCGVFESMTSRLGLDVLVIISPHIALSQLSFSTCPDACSAPSPLACQTPPKSSLLSHPLVPAQPTRKLAYLVSITHRSSPLSLAPFLSLLLHQSTRGWPINFRLLRQPFPSLCQSSSRPRTAA